MSGTKRTMIEEGTEFKGTMSSKCPLVVMGKVEGDLTGPSVEISASGVVAGNVKVDELRSEGELAGSVDAKTVHLSGRVRDKTVIRAQTLEVHLQRTTDRMEVVFGVCELAVGDQPNKADAIAAALAPPAEPAAAVAAAASPAEAPPSQPAAAAPGGDGEWDVSDSAAPAEGGNGKRGKGERSKSRTQPPPLT